jgi:rhodanese-related sulfurtransferase
MAHPARRRQKPGHEKCFSGIIRAVATLSADVPAISCDELMGELRRRRITLVDVLSPESFSSVHLPGAINLPVADLAGRAGAVLPDRRAPIVVYCGGPT